MYHIVASKTYVDTKNTGKPVPEDHDQGLVYEALSVLEHQKQQFMSRLEAFFNVFSQGLASGVASGGWAHVTPSPVDGSSRSRPFPAS